MKNVGPLVYYLYEFLLKYNKKIEKPILLNKSQIYKI